VVGDFFAEEFAFFPPAPFFFVLIPLTADFFLFFPWEENKKSQPARNKIKTNKRN